MQFLAGGLVAASLVMQRFAVREIQHFGVLLLLYVVLVNRDS